MKTLFLSIGLLLMAHWACAQEYLTIKGRIVDRANGKGVSYAHVGVPKAGIGTVSGHNGKFSLKIPPRYAKETLEVSFLGYKSYRRSIEKLKEPIVLRLERSATQLDEIIVMDEARVEDIIRRAVKRIPKNYPNYPTLATGFYRESRTDSEGNYMYLAEGVLQVYKYAYKKTKEGQTGLIQGRQVALVPEEELSKKSGFSSGHLSGHRFDFVKNREDFIDENYFPYYKYWIEGITSYDDQPVYIIGFDQQDDHKKGRMKGKVYIDTLSYAFLRAEFEIRPEALKKTNDYPLYSGRWKGNKYVVNYRKYDDLWYFGEALREGTYRDGGLYSNEFLVTELKPGRGKVIPYIQRLGRDDEFLDISVDYNEDFWKAYNTAPLSSGLQESVQQLKTRELAKEVFAIDKMAERQRIRDSVALVERKRLEAEGKDIEIEEPATYGVGMIARYGDKDKVGGRFRVGIGPHLLATPRTNMSINYLNDNQTESILSLSNTIESRDFEIVTPIGFDITIGPHWFVRYETTLDYLSNIYRSQSLGGGYQLNLSKSRPFFVRGIAMYNRLRYATKVGKADNDFGDFEVDGKKFKADKVNMYYGSRNHQVNLALEFALEIHPGMEFFISGQYNLPFAQKRKLFLWERNRFFLFRKREWTNIDERVEVNVDDAPFNQRITDFNQFSFFIGVIWK
ncbi:MAG: carboxypeptidase-like regulatory domain-containing protein [Bacteroidota bacterium]